MSKTKARTRRLLPLPGQCHSRFLRRRRAPGANATRSDSFLEGRIFEMSNLDKSTSSIVARLYLSLCTTTRRNYWRPIGGPPCGPVIAIGPSVPGPPRVAINRAYRSAVLPFPAAPKCGRLSWTKDVSACCGFARRFLHEWPGLSVMRRVRRPRFLRAGPGFGFSLVDQQIHGERCFAVLKVETPAAPGPIFGVLHQAANDGIGVHVV
jgi:hypothetical protein